MTLLSFMDAYTIWRALPMASGGRNPDLSEIKSDVAVADHYVSVVIRFVEQGIFQPAVPDVFALLDDIGERLVPLVGHEDPEVRDLARAHSAHAAILREVYTGFLEQAPR